MIYFLEYTDWDLVVEHLASQENMDLLSIILGEQTLPLERVRLMAWHTLNMDLAASEDLFGQDSKRVTLVDMEGLSLKKSEEADLRELSAGQEIYFYRSAGVGLSAEEKKIWKNLKYEYLTLKKPEPKTAQALLQAYGERYQLSLTSSQQAELLKKASNYTELLNILELVYLTQDPDRVLQDYFAPESLPVFMLPFSPGKLAGQVGPWRDKIGPDEVQLGLSLVYGKLDKQSSSAAKELQKELIRTDKKIKTNPKASGSTWWKLFLWKAATE
jgi:hypothetical protein